MTPQENSFEHVAAEIGALVAEKNRAYGDSFAKCGDFLRILWPKGIAPEQYTDALAMVRIFDKQMRIATDKNALGESPYRDIAGYAILGVVKDARETARAAFTPRFGGTEELLSTALRALCLTRDYVEPNVSLPAKEGWEWFDAGVKLSAAIPDDKWAKEFDQRRAAFTPVQEEKVSEPISCGTCGHNGYGCTPDALVAGCHNWTRKAEGAATFPFTFPPALKWMGKDEQDYDEKLIEEVDEVVKAKDNRDRMVELFDVIQTSETAIRDLAEKTGLDPAEVADAMVVKNRVRGYYEPQG